ncbi:MAG TPA: CHAD domain-containing protein [Candidatus Limnocylindrales bacterium]
MTETEAARPMEIELKFRMTDAATGERLLAGDELGGFTALGPGRTADIDDRYVDTAEGALARAGYAGRLRSGDGGTVITLKGLHRADEGGAVHRREELEGPAVEGEPAAAWPASDARDTVVRLAGDEALAEIAQIRQTRHKRDYGRDGAVVEVSVDDVSVISDGRVVERFAELELELREGEEAALEPLVDLLSEIEELVPAQTSKLERALAAVRREEPPAVVANSAPTLVAVVPPTRDKPATAAEAEEREVPRLTAGKTPGVLADDHIAEAGRKVLRFHLARMFAREAGTREGRDNEELHAMRVATRRQRAAWRVFGPAFDERRTRRHRQRLREVAADLGAVRDLDVLIEAAEAYQKAQSAKEGAAFEPLIATWRSRREAARVLLVHELDSKRYAKWTEEYAAFVQAEGAGSRPVGPTEPHRVRDAMPSRIWAAYEAVRAYEPVMRWADVNTLHDLRIAAKWLRYTLEFVREALGSEAGPVIEKVVALQDHLGWLHDADVAAGLARSFLVEHAGDLDEMESAAIGRYLVDRERELARLRRSVGTTWRGVSSLAFRRSLGRLVAGL